MQLSEEEVRRARDLLTQTDALAVARFMADLQRGADSEAGSAQIREGTETIGWVQPGRGGLTETGWFVADSCREYVFWRERQRRLPFAEMAPNVVSEQLIGKHVLEIGSGSGMNLMSIAAAATDAVGLEPVAIYRQIGAIFAEVEGYRNIEAMPGRAEELPFADGRFDTVLCVSAHQYFDLNPALREIARVLKPGGEVVLISGILSGYAMGQWRALLGGPGPARNYLVTLVNTLGYMFLGRRLVVRPSKWSTAYPIYPSRWSMRRMLEAAGLELVEPPTRVDGEAVFVARKVDRAGA